MQTEVEQCDHPKVVVRRVVPAARERVFDAWTSPELMEQWFFPKEGSAKSNNDLRVGGKYSHDMIVKERDAHCGGGVPRGSGYASYLHYGEYLEIKRPEKLVFTWHSPAVQNTRVTVVFTSVPDGTEITITHELLGTEELRGAHTAGWGECLDSLESFLT